MLSFLSDLLMVSLASSDDPTLVKANFSRWLRIMANRESRGLLYMDEIYPLVGGWKRLAEERYEEYSDMFVAIGLFRAGEYWIVMTFIRFSLPASLTDHVETTGRTPELYWNID